MYLRYRRPTRVAIALFVAFAGIATAPVRSASPLARRPLVSRDVRHLHSRSLQVNFSGIACPTSLTCFALGSVKGGPNGVGGTTILSTVNGGQSWSLQNNPLSRRWNAAPQRIVCPTPRVCYAVGSAGTILATTNAGHTWRNQRNPLSGTYRIIFGIACPSDTRCYAVGGKMKLLVTSNGGRSWHDQRSPLKPNSYAQSIACPGPAICYVVGGGYDMSGVSHSTLLATTNGGRSWHRQRSGTTSALGSISCRTVTICFAVGAEGTIAATRDGGTAWRLQHSPLTSLDFLSDIACPATVVCYAVGGVRLNLPQTRYVILATKNGGTIWTFQVAPLGATTNYTYPFSIACPAVDTCYVVGGRRLVATRDGGRTWRRDKHFQP